MSESLRNREPGIGVQISKTGSTNEWKVCCELDMLLAEAKCNKIKGTASRNRSGLGFKARQRVAGVSADKVQRA